MEADNADWELSADKKTFSVHDGLMQWSVAKNWTYLKSDGPDSHIYYIALQPNQALTEEDIVDKEGKITVSDGITKSLITSMTGITINFQATAVQSNGFDSPSAAWESVSGT